MSEQSTPAPTPLWRDPLFSPADRFPLGPTRWHWEGSEDGPSGSATRPFSLRGVVAGTRMDVEVSWPYQYCPERQVAFVRCDDGSMVPYLKHTKPGPTPVTSGTVDGQPGKPPPEEMASPDYQSD
jgi:hypothetical protein